MSANEVLRKVAVKDLQIGMYVIMPVSWKAHPFLVNRFRISSPAQIRKMREAGLTELMVDLAQSHIEHEPPALQSRASAGAPHTPDKGPEEKNRGVALDTLKSSVKEAVSDKTLPLEEKAKVVYAQSLEMINNVLEQPNNRNIGVSKEIIAEIVDMILADKDTSRYLTRITSHDFYTYTHSVNVGFLAVCLAKIVLQDASVHKMHELGAGFFLHDLGKVRIPPEIINKPGRLCEEEMVEIRKHPSSGFKILHECRQLTEECRTIVLQHHERSDGTGYPHRLRGPEIHIYGRICSIADIYDALTSDRPYRKRMLPFDALKLMKDEMMHHLQKDLFEKFVLMLS
jgi:HD-GYP domain-containing protein (c-di-GMP phosphodiesterase class II)